MRKGRLLAFVLTTVWLTAGAAAADYERRLIPVTVVLAPGAFGTTWTTRVAAVQELETGADIIGDINDMHGSVGRSQPYRIFPPPSQNEPPGSILYVPKEVADQVHISARIVRTGGGAAEETVLPVVSEDEFVAHTLYFLQLTKSAQERLHLRAYSFDLVHPSPVVRIRVQATWVGSAEGWTFVYDQLHSLTAQQEEITPYVGGDTFALRPLSIDFPLDPILRALPEKAEVAVSILPAAPGLRIWGMVTETNNVTQRVRIALPD